MSEIEITPSCGNIFKDLNLPDAETKHVKSGLIFRLITLINDRGLTQAAAAKLLGTQQSKISAMYLGKFRGVSVGQLCLLLTRMGCDVTISVTPAAGPEGKWEVNSGQTA